MRQILRRANAEPQEIRLFRKTSLATPQGFTYTFRPFRALAISTRALAAPANGRFYVLRRGSPSESCRSREGKVSEPVEKLLACRAAFPKVRSPRRWKVCPFDQHPAGFSSPNLMFLEAAFWGSRTR
jgi:hypothetical protein